MVHFKIPSAAAVVAPVQVDEDAAYAFSSRPVAKDVVSYRECALEFFCAISVVGARSVWGRSVDTAILVRIAQLAAPYIVSVDILTARLAEDKFAADYLMRFEPDFRGTAWWWQKPHSVESAMHCDGTGGGGILVGGICTVPPMDNDHINSAVMRQDDQGVDEDFVMVIEKRGSDNFYMDVMVHRDKTMRDLLRCLTVHFRLPSDQRTAMVFWGMRDDGTADLENHDGGLYLHSKHPSPMMDKSMGEMWTLMQKLADDMVESWRGDVDPALGHWDENVQEHREYWNIINNTIVLMECV